MSVFFHIISYIYHIIIFHAISQKPVDHKKPNPKYAAIYIIFFNPLEHLYLCWLLDDLYPDLTVTPVWS